MIVTFGATAETEKRSMKKAEKNEEGKWLICRMYVRSYAEILQLMLKKTLLETAGGTSFFAMQRYAPKYRRSTFTKLINSPSNVSLFRVLLFTFMIIGLPSSRLHVIPVVDTKENSFNLDDPQTEAEGLTRLWIATSNTKERSILTLIHCDIFGRFCIENVGRHWVGKERSSLFSYDFIMFEFAWYSEVTF